jgi:hypothetical protein
MATQYARHVPSVRCGDRGGGEELSSHNGIRMKNGDAHPSLFLEAAPKPTLLLKGETQ